MRTHSKLTNCYAQKHRKILSMNTGLGKSSTSVHDVQK